jgi:hypothetical protein
MVIQHSLARISSFYHASATTPLANHGDFFNTHACLQHQPMPAKKQHYFTGPVAMGLDPMAR